MALYIVGFDDLVTSFVATIATGWSDPCRVGLSPTGKPRLYAAHEKAGLVSASERTSIYKAAIDLDRSRGGHGCSPEYLRHSSTCFLSFGSRPIGVNL